MTDRQWVQLGMFGSKEECDAAGQAQGLTFLCLDIALNSSGASAGSQNGSSSGSSALGRQTLGSGADSAANAGNDIRVQIDVNSQVDQNQDVANVDKDGQQDQAVDYAGGNAQQDQGVADQNAQQQEGDQGQNQQAGDQAGTQSVFMLLVAADQAAGAAQDGAQRQDGTQQQ